MSTLSCIILNFKISLTGRRKEPCVDPGIMALAPEFCKSARNTTLQMLMYTCQQTSELSRPFILSGKKAKFSTA